MNRQRPIDDYTPDDGPIPEATYGLCAALLWGAFVWLTVWALAGLV